MLRIGCLRFVSARKQMFFIRWKYWLLVIGAFVAGWFFLDTGPKKVKTLKKQELPVGVQVTRLSEEHEKRIIRNFQSFADGLYRVSPGDLLAGKQFKEQYHHAYNFKSRSTDVFTICYPKTGSTWMQEILWTMIHNPNFDSRSARKPVYERVPFFDFDFLYTPAELGGYWRNLKHRYNVTTVLDVHEFMPNPRIFKTHLYFNLLNPHTIENSKFVYLIRLPADTCLSYYHFSKNRKRLAYEGSLEDFANDFLNGDCQYGSYLEHLRQWWSVRSLPNVLTIYYEHLLMDSNMEYRKIAKFLGLELTDDQISKIKSYTSFENTKKRSNNSPSSQYKPNFNFYREGKIGSSSKEMPEELLQKINDHFRNNLGGIELPYNLE